MSFAKDLTDRLVSDATFRGVDGITFAQFADAINDSMPGGATFQHVAAIVTAWAGWAGREVPAWLVEDAKLGTGNEADGRALRKRDERRLRK